MCGVAGYIGNRSDASYLVMQLLHYLTYRGYDSWGIVYGENEILYQHRQVGILDEKTVDCFNYNSNIALGHTRWATHGKVCIKNTHPIEYKGWYIVHNGTVEFKFNNLNDLDTLVLLKDIEYHYNRHAEIAIPPTVMSVGSFILYCPYTPNILYCYTDCHGLFMNNEGYICSDSNAITTPQPIPSKQIYQYKQSQSEQMCITTLATNTNTDVYHYMLNEIYESINFNIECDKTTEALIKITECQRITFVACGSSYYAALLGAYYWRQCGIDVDVQYATNFIPTHNDVYVFISQSGQTKDVIEAVKKIDAEEAYTITLQNTEQSPLSNLCKHTIYMHCGPEISVAATKSFTKTVMYLVFAVLNHPLSRIKRTNLKVKYTGEISSDIVNTIAKYKHILILGTNEYYPLALEFALKLKEVCYIHAEGMPASEVKHGPIALIDDATLTVVLQDSITPCREVHNNVQQIRSRNGKVIELYSKDILEAIITTQLITYQIARKLGRNVDKPRNLAKSVTV